MWNAANKSTDRIVEARVLGRLCGRRAGMRLPIAAPLEGSLHAGCLASPIPPLRCAPTSGTLETRTRPLLRASSILVIFISFFILPCHPLKYASQARFRMAIILPFLNHYIALLYFSNFPFSIIPSFSSHFLNFSYTFHGPHAKHPPSTSLSLILS